MTATPPAEAETRGSEAYEALKQALISGHFMPGQKLTLRMLAEALGMSVTPVREAIHRLTAERALEGAANRRSEEHTSELQSLMRISYAVFCLKKKNNDTEKKHTKQK